MTLFRKRPQLQAVKYVSPPSSEIVHVYPDDVTPASERAAKRRRIEGYARDVLKERPVFIASASLRGPFDKVWVNPWTRGREEGEQSGGEHGAAKFDGMGHRIESTNILVPETEARPMSRAGSDYCHDWLKKQHNAQRYTPDLDDEFDVQLREDEDEDEDEEHDGQETPSRPYLRTRQKSVRLAVAPAWSRDLPDQHQHQSTNPNSLHVNVSSGAPVRSVSEQPARNPYRGMLGTRGDTVDDTTLTKVSMISDDRPLPKARRGYSRAKTVQLNTVDSPGFVFRRVGADGRRPWSRGADRVKRSATTATSITEPDNNVDMEAHVWVSVADLSPKIDRQNVNAPVEEPDDGSEQDEESVTVRADEQGKWVCPMRDCPKRPKPYSSRSGIKGHLKNKHGVSRVVWEAASVVATAKPRDLGARDMDEVPVIDGQDEATAKDDGNQETAQATEENTHSHEKPAEPALQEQNQSPVSSATVTAVANPNPIDGVEPNEGENRPVLEQGDKDNGNADASTSRPTGQDVSSKVTSTGLRSNKASTSIPDRQDSRAYSTFTFNPEMSTQVALLRAHQAFQEDTQAPVVNDGDDSVLGAEGYEPAGQTADGEVTTPFRRPDIPSFFNRIPASAKGAVPMASTQDLVDAARDLDWSTVKKKITTTSQRKTDKKDKKRISFAGWPQAKPSQQGSLKAVEWSPSLSNAVDSPLPFGNTTAGVRGKSYSQPEEYTPLRSALAKPSASFSAVRRVTNTRASSPPPTHQHFAQLPGTSLPGTGVRSSGPPSAPSAMPIPSYQEAQGQDVHAYDDDGDEIEDQEIEEALDAAASFLSTWDVDKEVQRNSVQKKTYAAKAL